MTVTAQRILTELGYKAWSGFNADDMVFTSDDSIQARTELNGALRYLINLEDFPFRTKTKEIIAMGGIADYSTPTGQISSIYNIDTKNALVYVGDSTKYDKEEIGAPTHYWINYNNPKSKIRLYPIPDADYNMTITFSQFKPVKDADNGNLKFEFEKAEDYINLPENLQDLFMDCLVLKTMEQNNKDDQDENYQPIINEFNQRWRLFKKIARPVRFKPRYVWNS